jgi:hypothetical protein
VRWQGTTMALKLTTLWSSNSATISRGCESAQWLEGSIPTLKSRSLTSEFARSVGCTEGFWRASIKPVTYPPRRISVRSQKETERRLWHHLVPYSQRDLSATDRLPDGAAILPKSSSFEGVVGWDDGHAIVGGYYFMFMTQNPSLLYKYIRNASL